MSAPSATKTAPIVRPGPRQLVLLGAGPAHLQALARMATHPLPETTVTLVAPQPWAMLPGMLARFMAGHATLDDCSVPLEPWVQRTGIRWIQRAVAALDASGQSLTLDDGTVLAFDWLSIDTPATQDREVLEQTLPGVREHALFLRPLEGFATLWPRVLEMGASRPLRVTVIGGGASGIEMALAVRKCLPRTAVTLLSGTRPVGASLTPGAQQRLQGILKRRGITVLQERAVALKAGSVQLGCGADLACDVPLLATGPQPPAWLARSGLALDAQGRIVVDACQRSTSHSCVLATGELSVQPDQPLHAGSNADPRTGIALAHNLAAMVAGTALTPPARASAALRFVACGGRMAVVSWRAYSAQGWWVWKWKEWLDRRRLAHYLAPRA